METLQGILRLNKFQKLRKFTIFSIFWAKLTLNRPSDPLPHLYGRLLELKGFCACPLFDNEFSTISESKSIFTSFTLLFNNLCFEVLFSFKILNGCHFLNFEARVTFFSENVYLYVNSILEKAVEPHCGWLFICHWLLPADESSTKIPTVQPVEALLHLVPSKRNHLAQYY